MEHFIVAQIQNMKMQTIINMKKEEKIKIQKDNLQSIKSINH